MTYFASKALIFCCLLLGGILLFHADIAAQDNAKLQQEIIKVLRTVKDKELDVNVYDLGLVRKIEIKSDKTVNIQLIFTKLLCPYGKEMVKSIRENVSKIPTVKFCKVSVDIHTRWKREMMSPEGKEIMKNIYAW
jgi:metal-sulfur cluster biosynthetic enzyme